MTQDSIQLDFSYLNEISGGSNEFIIETINVLLEQCPILVKRLNQSVENHDLATTAEIAHQMKSSLAMVGLTEAHTMMGDIEQKSRNGEDIAVIIEDVRCVTKQCRMMHAVLEQHLKKLKQS